LNALTCTPAEPSEGHALRAMIARWVIHRAAHGDFPRGASRAAAEREIGHRLGLISGRLAGWRGSRDLQQRVARADVAGALHILDGTPDVPPDEEDEQPG